MTNFEIVFGSEVFEKYVYLRQPIVESQTYVDDV